MFDVLIENPDLKNAVQQLLATVFGDNAYSSEKTDLTIMDEMHVKQNLALDGCQAILLCSPDFNEFSALPDSITTMFLPFKPNAFIQRCCDLLKSNTVPVFEKSIVIQSFTFKPYEFLLEKSGEGGAVILTEKERNILLLLHEVGDQSVSKDEMLEKIWNYVPDIETHTLETHIYRLRQKIEEDPSSPEILVTGEKGYRLLT